MPLESNDLKHLTAVQGYVELGMFLDASEEFEDIDPEVRHVPEVLAVRVEIYRALEKWELMQTIAKKLTEVDPQNSQWPLSLAFATRRAESLDAARFILLEAWKVHEKEPLIPFKIACYLCQLGQVEIAKGMLEIALKLAPQRRLMALDDEDLKPLWDSIAASRGAGGLCSALQANGRIHQRLAHVGQGPRASRHYSAIRTESPEDSRNCWKGQANKQRAAPVEKAVCKNMIAVAPPAPAPTVGEVITVDAKSDAVQSDKIID